MNGTTGGTVRRRAPPAAAGKKGAMVKPYVLPFYVTVAVLLAAAVIAKGQTVEFFMANGQELLLHGAYNQAAVAFRQAIAREPDLFEAQYDLGLTYLQWANYPQAVIELKKALKLQPRNSPAWSSLALAYESQNNSAGAIDAFVQAVNCDPENVTARMNLAATYVNAKQYALAAGQYREIVKIDGLNSEALINLSQCLVVAGSFAEAKQVLMQAISVRPDKGEAHGELGDVYLKHDRDTGRAIIEYQAAIAIEPHNPQYYEQLAWALECVGRTAEALDAWKKAEAYLDDPEKKADVQGRIEQLERGFEPGEARKAGNGEESTFTGERTHNLERELHPEQPKPATPRLETSPIDVIGDLKKINADTTGDSQWDLNKVLKQEKEDRKR